MAGRESDSKIGYFNEDCDHGRSSNKDSKVRTFCKDCDHDRIPNNEGCNYGRSPIKTQKYDIFVIMVAVLIKRTANMVAILIKTQKYGIFVRIVTF